MDKVMCIITFSGRNIYVRTTEEKWNELTKDVAVYKGGIVTGWFLDQDKIEKIITSAYPEREDFKVVAITPWRHFYKEMGLEFVAIPPTPDYYIEYSSIDKPEATK